MAQKQRRSTKKKSKKTNIRHYLVASGIFLILFSLLAIFRVGFLGVAVANVCRLLVGNSYLLLAIVLFVYGGYLLLFQKEPGFENRHIIVGGGLLYGGILLLMTTYFSQSLTPEMRSRTISVVFENLKMDVQINALTQNVAGGMIGACLYEAVHFLVAQPGSYITSILMIAIGTIQFFRIDLDIIADSFSRMGEHFMTLGEHLRDEKEDWREKRALEKEARQAEKNRQKELHAEQQAMSEQEVEDVEHNDASLDDIPNFDEPMADLDDFLDDDFMEEVPTLEQEKPPAPNEVAQEEEETLKETPLAVAASTNDDDYVLPPVSLLNKVKAVDQSGERRAVEKKRRVLEQTFKSFGVDATVEDVHVGPAITKFEVKLAVGVKVSKIVHLSDDIALALAAKDVRIEAPIPGKSLIGIEVPNTAVSMVSFRDVIEQQPAHPDKILSVPLGKDISGDVIMCDLAAMPHLLIAGSTGSGKSVCINDIITSLLMQAKPNEVKMMMIDPKMVELSMYNGIPHLLTPVVTDARKASQALHKAVEEMERRYQLFAEENVRNIKGYNERIMETNQALGQEQPLMPLIVIIVDELADLMMVASKEVEDSIIRLAQKARAAGIHMILATQRPSVNVITGLIKANVPSRIAFAVSSGTDSRTILDSNGAEKLLGRGDMLFCPIGQNKPTRVQGAFISDAEVESVIRFIKEQREAEYQPEMEPAEVEETQEAGQSVHARFDEAVALVRHEQKASASMIQRRLHIGYNAAANIIEEMENRGMVGPANGAKPREVYLQKEENDDTSA